MISKEQRSAQVRYSLQVAFGVIEERNDPARSLAALPVIECIEDAALIAREMGVGNGGGRDHVMSVAKMLLVMRVVSDVEFGVKRILEKIFKGDYTF